MGSIYDYNLVHALLLQIVLDIPMDEFSDFAVGVVKTEKTCNRLTNRRSSNALSHRVKM